MEQTHITVELVERPARKVILKRGVQAEEYMAYCEEVGCEVWDILSGMKSLLGEPVCLWLRPPYQKPGTSSYVQGVEVPPDYDGPIPEGFDTIDLPAADYLLFRSEPFQDEDFCEAIGQVQGFMETYDPAVLGCAWDDENPRIQLEPWGFRGYMEFRAVKAADRFS